MKKNYCIYVFIFSAILLNIIIMCNSYKSKNNQDNYFRLHIVANSNSIDDQIIKLNVSKKITNYLNSLLADNIITNKNIPKELITQNANKIIEIADNEIKMYNEDYSSYVNIGKISYAEKYSDRIDMDKGIYDSVQVILGDGKGENFWSLIFPYSYNPNCTLEETNKTVDDNFRKDTIEFRSGILEDIKKVVKLFS